MPYQGSDEFKPFVFAIYLLNVKIDLQSYHSIKVSLALRNIQGGKSHFINIVNEIKRSFKNMFETSQSRKTSFQEYPLAQEIQFERISTVACYFSSQHYPLSRAKMMTNMSQHSL